MGSGKAWRSLWSSFPSSEEIWILRAIGTVSSPLLWGGRNGFFPGGLLGQKGCQWRGVCVCA